MTLPLPYSEKNPRRDLLMQPLTGKKVVVVGLGGGAPIPIELVKCGVDTLSLFDFDILESGNLIRHPCGPKYIGLPKVEAMKQYFEDGGYSHLNISTFQENIFKSSHITEQIASADLLIVATDSETSRFFLSEIAQEKNTPAIFVGMFENGCGGEIFVQLPESGCYCCLAEFVGRKTFIDEYVEAKAKEDCVSRRDVKSMPGLGVDQGLLCQIAARMSIDVLLIGMQHTLPKSGKNWVIFSISGINQVADHSFTSLQADIPKNPHCGICGNPFQHHQQ
jgi:molybdopterin/thiamine biosynthesis adenylyltransferase